MNRQYIPSKLLTACCLLLGPFLHCLSTTALAANVYVTVRETKLRSRADFFSPAVADVRYGDRLAVVDEGDAWLSVKTSGGKQGFIHQSGVTERKVVLKSSAKFDPNQTSQSDVVLAGKGFNSEVERRFAAEQRLNFSEVNAMEKIKISSKELTTFVEQGQLGGKEG